MEAAQIDGDSLYADTLFGVKVVQRAVSVQCI